jgi:hypothetical protein
MQIIAPYPPPPPQSRYQRTNNLGRGWAIRGIPYGAELENRVFYSRPVQGTPGQTGQHRATGWVSEEQAKRHVVMTGTAQRLMLSTLLEALKI